MLNNLCPIEVWDLERSVIPPRSLLHPVEPMGLGTNETESLTSYLIRLAESHSVRTATLFHCVLVPAIQAKSDLPEKYRTKRLLLSLLRPVNGPGFWAMHLSELLEQLTTRKDIRFLTLDHWRDVFPKRHLIKSTRHWCPECLVEQANAGLPIHDLLIWSVYVVNVCPKHRRPLRQRCPHCEQIQSIISLTTGLGECYVCGHSLSSATKVNRVFDVAVERNRLKLEVWIAEQFGDLIASTPLIESPSAKRVFDGLRTCYHQLGKGSLTHLADMLQANRSMFSNYWRGSEDRPDFGLMLEICAGLGTSLKDLLTGNHALDQLRLRQPPTLSCRNHPTAHSPDLIRIKLVEALNSSQTIPLERLAAQLHCCRAYLRRCYPDLTSELARRHRQTITKNSQRKKDVQCQKVREAVKKVHDQGEMPFVKRIAEEVGSHSLLQEALDVRNQILKDLGYTIRGKRRKPISPILDAKLST
jgi:hypothetical protein